MPELDLPPEGTLEWAEELYGHGMADEVSGDVEAPTGHFYRVDRWIVTTDSRGFREIDAFPTEGYAHNVFESLDAEYAEWEDESTE